MVYINIKNLNYFFPDDADLETSVYSPLQPPNAAARPRIFYRTQSPRKLCGIKTALAYF